MALIFINCAVGQPQQFLLNLTRSLILFFNFPNYSLIEQVFSMFVFRFIASNLKSIFFDDFQLALAIVFAQLFIL